MILSVLVFCMLFLPQWIICSSSSRIESDFVILCRTACRAGQKGVFAGEYIAGRCTGRTFRDVQTCFPCKTCPAGHWPSGVCSGLTFADTIECKPCATMASCPNTTHYYLEGNCNQEEVRCQLCDPPCDPDLYVEVWPCGRDGKNRVCVPRYSFTFFCEILLLIMDCALRFLTVH